MLAYIVWAVTTDGPVQQLVPLAAVVAIGATAHRVLTRWDSMLVALIAVIMLIPIRRYTMPGDLPFELEPYRVLVALLAAAWVTALLVDPRVRVRRSGFEGPLALIAFATVGSVIVNGNRISELGVDSEVTKKLTFFASFLLVFYLVVSVTRWAGGVDLLVKTFVAAGAIVAMFAIYETRTGYNFFDHLSGFVPFIEINEYPTSGRRGGQIRATGSAQHPIALGAALVMLTPLAVYLARMTGRRRWYGAAALLCLGSLATVSRTGVLMLLVVGVVFIWLRPKEAKRMWPALIPAIVVIHFAMPGALGTIRGAFFPEGGLIADQMKSAGTRGSGRVADLGPALSEWSQNPVLGQGFGTRIVDRGKYNAQILDNQWLKTLLETGVLGLVAWVWLYARAIRRFGRHARDDPSPRGWLLAALTAALAAFAFGMVTYDAYSFIQVTFISFLFLAIAASLAQAPAAPAVARLVDPTPPERFAGADVQPA
jgi:O-antigen ligase